DQPSGRHEAQKPTVGVVAAASPLVGAASGGPAAGQPPLIPGISLPQLPGNLPVGEGLVPAPQPGVGRGRGRLPSGIDEDAIRAEDALIPREVLPTGPTAQLSLFGSAPAVGRSFVFVIDRSQSMG